MCKIIILVENEVVVASSDAYEQVQNGVLINGCIYPFGGIFTISDQIIIPQKHKYANGLISINQEYMNQVDVLIQEAIDAYTIELVDGGLL